MGREWGGGGGGVNKVGQKILFYLGLGLTQCYFFFRLLLYPSIYSQSSQNQPPWESIKAVATRAVGHLREWDLISNHVINLRVLSAVAHFLREKPWGRGWLLTKAFHYRVKAQLKKGFAKLAIIRAGYL